MSMSKLRSLALLLAAACGTVSASSGSAPATIGPGSTLKIVNDYIAPDGFARP